MLDDLKLGLVVACCFGNSRVPWGTIVTTDRLTARSLQCQGQLGSHNIAWDENFISSVCCSFFLFESNKSWIIFFSRFRDNRTLISFIWQIWALLRTPCCTATSPILVSQHGTLTCQSNKSSVGKLHQFWPYVSFYSSFLDLYGYWGKTYPLT